MIFLRFEIILFTVRKTNNVFLSLLLNPVYMCTLKSQGVSSMVISRVIHPL